MQVTLVIENIFWVSLSNTKSKGSGYVPLGEGSGKNLKMSLMRKKLTLNSNMVKPEKCDHLQLVYLFTIPLPKQNNIKNSKI